MSRIEQLIGEIEMYLDSCKSQAFSNSKRIVVEKDVIDEMLVELRMRTPEEIKKYQKIDCRQGRDPCRRQVPRRCYDR